MDEGTATRAITEDRLENSLSRIVDLTDAERGKLRALRDRAGERFPPRTTIIRQASRPDAAFIVRSGWLIEHKTLRDGRRQIQNFRFPGEVVGLVGLAYPKALFAVSTLNDVEIARMTLDEFQDLRSDYPRLATAILLRALRTEAILREWEVTLGRRNGFERLAHLLLELHLRLRLVGLATDGEVMVPLTQEEISDCLGLTTVYVNRLLGRMRREGLVSLNGNSIVIDDAEALREASGFEPGYLRDFDPFPQAR